MVKRLGLPETMKTRQNYHLMDDIAQRSKTPVIRNIPIDKIITNEFQPRKDMGNLKNLIDSIRENGIFEPILVRPKSGNFEIIAGERRYRAAIEAGVKEIPCIEHDIPDNEALEISIIENIQRKDLNWFEEAHSLKILAEAYGYTHEEIAHKVSKSRVTITELIRLEDLPKAIQEKCLKMNIQSKTFLLELAKLETTEKMIAVLDQYSEQSFSREEIKKQRKESSKKNEENGLPKIHKKIRFQFQSEDKKIKVNFVMHKKHTREEFVEWLKKLLEDIQENRIEDLPF